MYLNTHFKILYFLVSKRKLLKFNNLIRTSDNYPILCVCPVSLYAETRALGLFPGPAVVRGKPPDPQMNKISAQGPQVPYCLNLVFQNRKGGCCCSIGVPQRYFSLTDTSISLLCTRLCIRTYLKFNVMKSKGINTLHSNSCCTDFEIFTGYKLPEIQIEFWELSFMRPIK